MKTKKSKLGFGWVPDLPDQRDIQYAAPFKVMKKLPPKVDLRAQCPKVYDQGELGSCTANAIGAAIEFEQMKQKKKTIFTPSRLFIYYNEREIEHSIASDSGAMIRDGIKSVNKKGACPEKMWKYDESKFIIKPPKECYTKALDNQVTSYQRITQSSNQMKGCLADGFPFVFGFSVYDGFVSDEVEKTGELQMPKSGEGFQGGHAVMAVGYDDGTQRFIVRNSWGNSWGMKGYFTMPYAYMNDSDLSSDFWTIRLVE